MSAVLADADFGTIAGGFIDGERYQTHGPLLRVEDPATTGKLAEVFEATEDDVALAVESAHAAFASAWRDCRPVDRARVLARIAAAISAAKPELARLESLDTGKPLRQAQADVDTAARYFEFYAGAADKLYGSMIPGDGDYWAYTLREPYGVVAHVTPWNSPLGQMCRGVAPSLAAGNTVVVKPSEITPLSTLAVADIFVAAGLPPGVCNVVVGCGPTTGAALIRHPKVAHVAFTGSVPTGREVLRMTAERIVGANLELGGKSPTIVLPDADMDAAVKAGAAAVIRNAGQSCFATTRLIVHRSIVAEYTQRLATEVSALSQGPGLTDPDIGPVASRRQLDKVTSAITSAVAEGAELLTGGTRPADLPGYFLTPAIIVGVDNAMQVARQEIFGPVQTVLTYDNIEDAIDTANDSSYGLAAGVFTRDISMAHRVARRLQAGQIQVNAYPLGGVETPFGGYKESGIGREKGLAALEHYTQLKTVIIKN
jgi:aldehyde dehydrogenase (NAD+)